VTSASRSWRIRLLIFSSALAVPLALAAAVGQLGDTATDIVREPSIAYYTTAPTDRVARLNAQIQSGAVALAFDPVRGYLPSVLHALQLSVDSQLLVYSKTSVQATHISPRKPRSIYFYDAVTVGYIRGADYIEFAVQDPRQGTIFYTLDQKAGQTPTIERRDFCLSCHYGFATAYVPGPLVRSIVTSPTGGTLPFLGNAVVDHSTPVAERWGGYYVTGTHGGIRHLGNALVDRERPDEGRAAAQNLTTVRDRFDADAYLSADSDIAALLVFDHQMRMMNLLTRAAWEVRVAAAQGKDVAAVARDMAVHVVDYMLFIDEAPLPAHVRGTTDFAHRFAGIGPRDRRGRSLRELALDGRLMRYPCSYMIYSDAFAALPPAARAAIDERLARVLTGAESDPRYGRLGAADRTAILEILRDTRPDWTH
jgi:hypothetical protein